jgi:hypothetical protein
VTVPGDCEGLPTRAELATLTSASDAPASGDVNR